MRVWERMKEEVEVAKEPLVAPTTTAPALAPSPAPPPEIDVSVVVPVFNEEEGIERCHAELLRVLAPSGLRFEFVYVDDGSRDGSVAKMQTFLTAGAPVRLVKLKRNTGQQRALWVGLHHARGRAIVTFDSDLQFAPECIPELARKIFEGADIAGGIRVSRQDPLLANRIPSWVGKHLINRALRVDQQDFGAVKAYSRRLARDLAALTDHHLVLPAAAFSLTKNFVEIPVEHRSRELGVTKWSVFRRIEFYLNIYTAYAPRPFEWMMISGAASLITSLLLGLGILIYRLLVSADFRGTIIFFDVFLFMTGIQLFSLSLIGEFAVRSYRKRHDSEAALVEEVRAP